MFCLQITVNGQAFLFFQTAIPHQLTTSAALAKQTAREYQLGLKPS